MGPPPGPVAAVRVAEQEAHPDMARSACGPRHRHHRDGHGRRGDGGRVPNWSIGARSSSTSSCP